MPRSRKPPLRQFHCETCNCKWWTRVPNDDPVAECRKCHGEWEALPRERESGWAKFECKCGNKFTGFATMINPADSPCYKCKASCAPLEVMRFANDKRKRPRRTQNRHSCSGVNCYNQVQGIPARGDCVHPNSSARPRVNNNDVTTVYRRN